MDNVIRVLYYPWHIVKQRGRRRTWRGSTMYHTQTRARAILIRFRRPEIEGCGLRDYRYTYVYVILYIGLRTSVYTYTSTKVHASARRPLVGGLSSYAKGACAITELSRSEGSILLCSSWQLDYSL